MLRSSLDDPYHHHYHTEVNSFCIFPLYNAEWIFLGGEGGVEGILPTAGGHLLYKRKPSELCLVHVLEALVDVFLIGILPVP